MIFMCTRLIVHSHLRRWHIFRSLQRRTFIASVNVAVKGPPRKVQCSSFTDTPLTDYLHFKRGINIKDTIVHTSNFIQMHLFHFFLQFVEKITRRFDLTFLVHRSA